MDSYSGSAIWDDLKAQFKRPEGQRIGEMILREFKPGGIELLNGKVAKKFDGERVWRVVWKILKGLFFEEYGRFLPEDVPKQQMFFSPGETPPSDFDFFQNISSKGLYPGVFNYKYYCFEEINNLHVWAISLWDKITIIVAFHDPACPCEECKV